MAVAVVGREVARHVAVRQSELRPYVGAVPVVHRQHVVVQQDIAEHQVQVSGGLQVGVELCAGRGRGIGYERVEHHVARPGYGGGEVEREFVRVRGHVEQRERRVDPEVVPVHGPVVRQLSTPGAVQLHPRAHLALELVRPRAAVAGIPRKVQVVVDEAVRPSRVALVAVSGAQAVEVVVVHAPRVGAKARLKRVVGVEDVPVVGPRGVCRGAPRRPLEEVVRHYGAAVGVLAVEAVDAAGAPGVPVAEVDAQTRALPVRVEDVVEVRAPVRRGPR